MRRRRSTRGGPAVGQCMAGSAETFEGYERLELLGSTTGATLFRAQRAGDQRPVLLKLAGPGPDRLAWEHETLRSLDLRGVARPLEHLPARPELAPAALVLVDAPGQLLEGQTVAVPVGLRLAACLAEALEGLHRARLVHGDLRPANIVAGADGESAVLVDFSRAAFSEGAEAPAAAGEVDWAYVSPEQTGRVDRPVDHRTDLYSLGITLFRLLTGRLPFQAGDPLEWCHCHIARLPALAHEINPRVPPHLSAIVARLLAKDPDERYQTARGVRHDLERCRESLDGAGSIPVFELGRRDVADRLRLPSRLFGRRDELARLERLHGRVASSGETATCLVTGDEGAGKTMLVGRLREQVIARGGTFASARFDRQGGDRPYAFLSAAFAGLLPRLLAGTDEDSIDGRQRLQQALAGDARGLIAAVPALGPILGPQPGEPEDRLDPQRFRRLVRRFVGIFCRPGRPLVLFLDDLQWADPASLKAVADLVTHPETRSLLVVGAWRGPLDPSLEALGATELRLGPLPAGDLAELVAASLGCDPAGAAPLAALLGERTGNNPVLVHQLLTGLEREGLLAFDDTRGEWRWDLDRIRAAAVIGQPERLTVDRIARLPETTRSLLEWAACLGRQFGLGSLAQLCGRSRREVAEDLRPAVAEDLVLTSVGDLVGERELAGSYGYHWLHDRVRQAAYALIPSSELPRRHLAIARLLGERPGDQLFAAVSHYARAAGLLEGEERARVAELNLAAGHRARETCAHASALHYFDAALALLPDDLWQTRPELAGPLFIARAECHLHGGDPRETVRLGSLVAARARPVIERATALWLVREAQVVRGAPTEAAAATLAGLALIGVRLPASPSWASVEDERIRVEHLLSERADRAALPAVPDPEIDAVMRLAPGGDVGDRNLYCLHVARMVGISLERGPFEGSCLCLAA
jgi:hypothetical protein